MSLKRLKNNIVSKIMEEKLSSILVGVSGEYLVAGELSLRGYIASITLRNSRGIDIVASVSNGKSSISIQVKANSNGRNSWLLSKASEEFYSKNHYYIFVALQELGERSKFYIVPSKEVAEQIKAAHEEWLKNPGRNGFPRRDTPMRTFSITDDNNNKYYEKWNLLEKAVQIDCENAVA